MQGLEFHVWFLFLLISIYITFLRKDLSVNVGLGILPQLQASQPQRFLSPWHSFSSRVTGKCFLAFLMLNQGLHHCTVNSLPNEVLFFCLCVDICGLWAPVWLYAQGAEKSIQSPPLSLSTSFFWGRFSLRTCSSWFFRAMLTSKKTRVIFLPLLSCG